MSWKVILPEEATNMVLNPVAMGTGNYFQRAGTTVTQSTTYSYLGYKSYRVETNADAEGIEITLATLPAGGLAAIHYASMRIRGTLPAVWVWSLNGADLRAPNLVSIEGDWTIYGYQFSAADSNASTKLYVMQSGAGAGDFYIGHIQVEENTYATTPITGDIKGFTDNGYYWNGAAHASSSTRSGQERKGGVAKDLLNDYNFKVLYGEGSGMPPITHHVQGMALLPGALFQGSKAGPRVLDLASATQANTSATVAAARKNFINAIKSDRVSPEQPVVFRYTAVNENKPVDFYAYYDSGMEFQLSSGVIDKPVARFIAYDPYCYETHTQSKYLTQLQAVADADYIVRKIDGVWYNISTDFNAPVRALTQGINGIIYIGGEFNNGAAANYIVQFNPYTSTLSQLTGGVSSGTNGDVYALTTAPNGDIYFGGSFALAGTIANTVKIAYWDISASEFVPLSTGITTGIAVYALVFGQNGHLFVGGSFINVGDADGDCIVEWTGAGWSSLGPAGASGAVQALAITPNGDLIAAGTFATIGGVACAGIARWDGTTWHPLGSGLTGSGATGYALAIDQAGNVIVGGDFTHADGVACANIAKWNGKTFEPLGSGLNDICYSLKFNRYGLLYAGGFFTSAGGISLSDRMAIWNGTTWAHVDIDLPGAPIVYAILPANNDLYIGYSTSGTAYSSYLNTVTNSGSTSAYPVIHIKRYEDGTINTIEWIKNEITGDTLWLNYSLQKGEELIIDLTPGSRSIKSTALGDVWRAVLRSSDFSSFRLLPETNYISVFVLTDATRAAWVEFPITHWSADMVAS